MITSAKKTDDLNDSLADLLGGEVSTEPRGPVNAPETYAPAKFEERCRKCGGRGYWRPGYPCFACKGVGKKTFKTSPDERAHQRVARETRAANKGAANWHAFCDAQPEVSLWITQSAESFPFAASMRDAIEKYGDLTENQLAACQRAIAGRKARAEQAAARIASAPVADTAGIDRLKAAFDTAIAKASEKGLKMKTPKITIGGMVIKPAKASGSNPGALYVTTGGTYLGKVTGGKFFASRDCSAEQEAKVLAFVADPKAAATAYGQTTGTCCICNATLTSKWKHLGIGPICADKFGW